MIESLAVKIYSTGYHHGCKLVSPSEDVSASEGGKPRLQLFIIRLSTNIGEREEGPKKHQSRSPLN